MSGADIKCYLSEMGRWQPDARGRLEEAALALYLERGFDNTTVAEIAQRAGLTERTFFRYFADKREVLFWGSGMLRELLSKAAIEAPASATPMGAVTAALDAAGAMLQERGQRAKQRQKVIMANPELQERELLKMASLASTLGEALRQRGVGDPVATLTAETGIAVLRVAFARWVEKPTNYHLPELIRESLEQLQAITTTRT
jgi:AcrR family transcriptional regulator